MSAGATTVAGFVVVPVLAAFLGQADRKAASDNQKPVQAIENCTDGGCHADLMGRKHMHAPTAQRACLDCHEYASAELHLFRFTMPRRELCGNCHTLELQRHVHSPVEERLCTGCHDPHGSEHAGLLHAKAAPDLCFTCHDHNAYEMKFVHGPVALGACMICHDPHSTSHEDLLTQSADTLCVDCHSEADPAVLGESVRHLHKPLEDGCTRCHSPHASDLQYQLYEGEPDLCFSCHGGMESMIGDAAVHHGPVGSPGAGSCTSCHSPHFSHLPKLQREPQPAMCLSCHDQTLKAADGRQLTNIALLLKENPSHHGPIRNETGGSACTGCHQPHAGERFNMLYAEYPAEFYAPFQRSSYDLCFSCHLPDLVLDESGTGLTGFRAGDLNLHWLHVNREKGRTCRACHEVHASSRPFHIRETVPFGRSGWMLEINFEKSEDGGGCAPGCHTAVTYSRTEPRPAVEDAQIGGDVP